MRCGRGVRVRRGQLQLGGSSTAWTSSKENLTSFCLCPHPHPTLAYPFFLEGRTQKEKKAARARSKGKNSDEEAPKAAQKKLKLVRT